MPHRSACAWCSGPVLLVDGHVVDVRELFPAGHCGRCRGKGEIRGEANAEWTGCPTCDATGVVGEPLPPPGTRVVLVDRHGLAREAPVEARTFGEAIHRPHRCAQAAAAAA